MSVSVYTHGVSTLTVTYTRSCSISLKHHFKYLIKGTHLMVTERTMATMPRPQHKACISFGFLSQVQVVIRQLGSTTSTLTILERKSLVDPAVPTAIASQTDKSGTRPRTCRDSDIVSSTWDNLDNFIPLSTFTLK